MNEHAIFPFLYTMHLSTWNVEQYTEFQINYEVISNADERYLLCN
jgi:hypothetical protein